MHKLLSRIFSAEGMLGVHNKIAPLEDSKSYYNSLFKMAWPSVLESVLISLIGSIDLMMVGNLGPAAISAIGITNQPKFILLALIFSLNMGVTAIVARRRGADDSVGANRCMRQSILLSLLFSVFGCTLGFVFAEPLMAFAGADQEFLALSVEYFQILVVSVFLNGISLTINAAQRGAGNTKISLKTNLMANVVNLILNFFLINGIWIFPRLEVRGAAIATVIGSAVGCLFSILSVMKPTTFLSLRNGITWKFDRQTLKSILNISSSAMFEQVFMRIGFFAYAKIIAVLGTVAFATHQICMTIINLSFAMGDGIAVATSSLVGQSLGKERPDEAIIFGKTGQRIAFGASTVLFFVFLFGGEFFVSLFANEESVIALGGVIMIIIAFTTHLQTSQVVMSGCLRGAGDTKFVAVTSLVSIALVRPVLTYILCFPMGLSLVGAWIALLLDQAIRLVFNFGRFSKGKWTKIKI